MGWLYLSSLSIFTICLWITSAQQDFQFENGSNDDLQVMFTEPQDEAIKSMVQKNSYSKEYSECPYTENKIILSLVLRSHDWSNIVDNKKNRTLNKLSKFFAVPKDFIKMESVSKRELYEMAKSSIKRGRNKIENRKTLGKLEFTIGCGDSYFTIGEPISNQIAQQMKDGSIDDISGINFGWWAIWKKRVSNRVQRFKRDAEGSGDDYNEDYDYGDEDDESITELPTETTHAHRHHHGASKPWNVDFKQTESTKLSVDTNTIETNIKHKKNDIKPLGESEQLPPSIMFETDEDIIKSVSKLESDIVKTIENANRFKEAQLEAIKNKMKKENNLYTSSSSSSSSPVPSSTTSTSTEHIQTEIFRNKKLDDDYIVEDIATESKITSLPDTAGVVVEITESSITAPTTYITPVTTPIIEKIETTSRTEVTTPIIITTTTIISTIPTTTISTTTPTTTTTTTTTEIPTTTTPALETSSKEDEEQFLSTTTTISTTTTTTSTSTESTVLPTKKIRSKSTTTTLLPNMEETNTNSENNGTKLFTTTEILPTTIDTTSEATTITPIYIIPKKEDDTPLKSDAEHSSQATPRKFGIINISNSSDIEDSSATLNPAGEISPSMETTQSVTTRTSMSTTPKSTISTTTTTQLPSTEFIEPEPINTAPVLTNRLAKQPVTAGKPFSLTVPMDTFYDAEDKTNLRLELYDKYGNSIKSNSWIQFNPEAREIYGLPLEETVSKYQYILVAFDSKNETVNETLDITVQQHKGHRSVNHEISLFVRLNNKFKNSIDWQIRLIRGIVETLNDKSLSNVVVKDVRMNQLDPYTSTFIYTNESLPKDKCPEEKLNDLVKLLDTRKLTDSLYPEITVKQVTAQPVGPCLKPPVTKPKPTPHMTKNYPPVPRNQVDRVNATIGQLLIFKVPSDTFYDPEDNTDLKLSLLTAEQTKLDPRHWLQFDPKNQEFYGVPKYGDYGQEQYFLVAEDHEGLTATDALIVEVAHAPKRDFSVLFKLTLGISYATFNSSHMQRRFLERVAQLLGDPTPMFIQIRSIQPLNDTGHIMISFYNTTLYRLHLRCPDDEIEAVRNIWLNQDSSLRDRVKKFIGSEFNLQNAYVVPVGSCHVHDITPQEIPPIKTEDKKTQFKDDYLLTFILPAIIILAMLLLASIIACVLHRRRLTGKMELGDEEERRSFRSKGIPVIFQDELDEKPEIGNKSPIILKDEKPPLLPPSYNSTNLDGDNDVDEYVPPPNPVVGGREVRGKSPVTPSYRKPPPYVSP